MKRISVVWVVPLVALVVAAWLVFDRVRQWGPTISITFSDGAGLRVGQTPLKYRGVQVGEVTGIELSEDQRHVVVKARLQHSAVSIAREGTTFWIVRPQVGFGSVTGLGTVITGPEIQALPGKADAEQRTEFAGLDSAPVEMESAGLKIVLRAERPKSLKPHSPVYYRGVEVGIVQEIDLGRDASTVDMTVLIRQRYARLVRNGTVFWNASGATVSGGLFRGIEVKVESLRALAAGGIEFATPDEAGARVKAGTVFPLHEEPRKEWLTWTPKIVLPQE